MNGTGGIWYAIIIENGGKLYLWYRNFEGYLEVMEDKQMESKVTAVLSEPSGIMELLDAHIVSWMSAHQVEEIGGFIKPLTVPSVSAEERIRQLELSVHLLAHRLKHAIRERDTLVALQKRCDEVARENFAIVATNLMNKVLPLEAIVACAVVHGGCTHIAKACDDLVGTIGEYPKKLIESIVGH